jgi:3'(2'), 5'-bisphosphate nucleotidase
VVLGVVYIPVTDEMFYAASGLGAWREGNDQPLSAPTYTLGDSGLRVVASRSHLNEATQAFVDGLDAPLVVSRGSSLKMIEIARGQADVYPRLAPTMEWDTAAAQAILQEAGGKMIDQSTGQPMAYNKETLLNNHFIAYGRVEKNS